MPKAEVGSLKHLSNQMKAKGLQRLRWYCQAWYVPDLNGDDRRHLGTGR